MEASGHGLGPSVVSKEAPKGQEVITRKEVIATVNRSAKAFEGSLRDRVYGGLVDQAKKGEQLSPDAVSKLSVRDRKALADFRVMSIGKARTIDVGADSFDNILQTGDKGAIVFHESMPVEGLISFLESEIKTLQEKEDPTDAERKTLEQRMRDRRILVDSSRDFLDNPRAKTKRKPQSLSDAEWKARNEITDSAAQNASYRRFQQEAEYINEDPLRNPGDEKADWYAGRKALLRRRELVMPDKGGIALRPQGGKRPGGDDNGGRKEPQDKTGRPGRVVRPVANPAGVDRSNMDLTDIKISQIHRLTRKTVQGDVIIGDNNRIAKDNNGILNQGDIHASDNAVVAVGQQQRINTGSHSQVNIGDVSGNNTMHMGGSEEGGAGGNATATATGGEATATATGGDGGDKGPFGEPPAGPKKGREDTGRVKVNSPRTLDEPPTEAPPGDPRRDSELEQKPPKEPTPAPEPGGENPQSEPIGEPMSASDPKEELEEIAAGGELPVAPIKDEVEDLPPAPVDVDTVRREIYLAKRDSAMSVNRDHARRIITEQLNKKGFVNFFRNRAIIKTEKMWEDRITSYLDSQMIDNRTSFLQLDLAATQLKIFSKVKDTVKVDAISGIAAEQQAGLHKIDLLKKVQSGEVSLHGHKVEEGSDSVKKEVVDQILRPLVEADTTGDFHGKNPAEVHKLVQEKLKAILRSNAGSDATVNDIFGDDGGELFASNLIEQAQMIRADTEAHKYAVEAIGENIDLFLADARWGGAQKITGLGTTDRMMEWVQKRYSTGNTGGNPAFVSAAFGVGIYGGLRAVKAGAHAVTFVPLVGAVPGALVAVARRNYQLKRDRAMHLSDSELGMAAPAGAKRRERMEQFSYSRPTVSQLLEGGGNSLVDKTERKKFADLLVGLDDPLTRVSLTSRVAEIQARTNMRLADQRALITFEEGQQGVEHGELELIKAIVQGRKALEAHFGGDDAAKLKAKQLIDQDVQLWEEALQEERGTQDQKFKSDKMRQLTTAGAVGLGVGVGTGLLMPFVGGFVAEHGGEHVENVIAHAIHKVREEVPGFIPVVSAKEQLHKIAGTATDGGGSRDIPLGATGDIVKVDGNSATIVDVNGHVLGTGTYDSSTGGVTFQHLDAAQVKELKGLIGDEKSAEIGVVAEPSRQDVVISQLASLKPGQSVPMEIDGMKVVVDGGVVGGKHELTIGLDGKILHGTVDGKGNMVIDTAGLSKEQVLELDKKLGVKLGDGYVVDTEKVPGSIGIETKSTADVWNSSETQVNKYEWYAYDTPNSDGNELEMFTYKDGDKLILDMSHMKGAYQQGNTPVSINVPDVIDKHKSVFAFNMPGQPDQPIIIPDGADGVWDGKLTLDPGDQTHWIYDANGKPVMTLGDFSKMIINKQAFAKLPNGNIATELKGHQDVFNLRDPRTLQNGFINAGTVRDDQNGKTLQSFATIRGTGTADSMTPVHVVKSHGHRIIKISPTGKSTETEYTVTAKLGDVVETPIPPVPVVERAFVPPPIPTVWTPRWPLEAVGVVPSEKEDKKDDLQVPPVIPIVGDPGQPGGVTTQQGQNPDDELENGVAKPVAGDDAHLQPAPENELTSALTPEKRAEAITNGAKEFASSDVVKESEITGGINKAQAEKMYVSMTKWLGERPFAELTADDPRFGQRTKDVLFTLTKGYFSNKGFSDETIRSYVNLALLYGNENKDADGNRIFDVREGDVGRNYMAILSLYDMVKKADVADFSAVPAANIAQTPDQQAENGVATGTGEPTPNPAVQTIRRIPVRPIPVENGGTSPENTVNQPAVPVEASVNIVNGGRIIDELKDYARTTTNAEFHANVTPDQLAQYARSIELPQGANLKNFSAKIVGKELQIVGNVGRGPINVPFTVSLQNDASGGMVVTNHMVKLPLLARQYKGVIESQVGNLNSLLTDVLTGQLDGLGKSTGFRIEGDKLRFDFKKTPPGKI